MKEVGAAADQEGADAARPHRHQPVLRTEHAHAHVVRARREAAERRHARHDDRRARASSKGETLADTARTLEAMAPDMIVMRHGVVRRAASARADLQGEHHQRRRRHARASDAGAARRVHDASSGRAGSPACASRSSATSLHSRVLRSNALLLTQDGRRRPRLRAGDAHAARPRPARRASDDVASTKPSTGADVVMMLRVQHERMHGLFLPSVREYFTLFGLTPARLERAGAAT